MFAKRIKDYASLEEKLVETFGIPNEEIKETYDKAIENFKKMYPEREEDEITEMAIRRTETKYRSMNLKDYKTFKGFFISRQEVIDGVRRRRENAIEAYKREGLEAVKRGLIAVIIDGVEHKLHNVGGFTEYRKTDIDIETYPDLDKAEEFRDAPEEVTYVIPLDGRKNWASGGENQRYLQPLPKHSYFTSLMGIASVYDPKSKKQTSQKLFNLAVNDNLEKYNILDIDVRLFTPVTFIARASTSSLQGEIMNINSAPKTEFMYGEGSIELSEEVIDVMKTKYVAFSDLTSYWNEKGRLNPYDTIITETEIVEVGVEPSQSGRYKLTGIDPNNFDSDEVTLWFNKYAMDAVGDLAIGDLVILIGQLRLSLGFNPETQNWDDEETATMTMNVTGAYITDAVERPPIKTIQPEDLNLF